MLITIAVGHIGYLTCEHFFVQQFNSQRDVCRRDVGEL